MGLTMLARLAAVVAEAASRWTKGHRRAERWGELAGDRITAQGCDFGTCTLAAGQEGDCGGSCRDIWELNVQPPTKLQGLCFREFLAPELPKMYREIQRTSQRWIDRIIDSPGCFS